MGLDRRQPSTCECEFTMLAVILSRAFAGGASKLHLLVAAIVHVRDAAFVAANLESQGELIALSNRVV